jgi:hypothetical protein
MTKMIVGIVLAMSAGAVIAFLGEGASIVGGLLLALGGSAVSVMLHFSRKQYRG